MNIHGKKIDIEEFYKFILEFTELYNQTPGVGFLAGYYKSSKSLIYKKLNILEEKGKIRKIKGMRYKTNYEVIINI